MSTITLDSRPASVTSDFDAVFREDFLQLVAGIGVNSDEAARLVEASSGQPFAACSPVDMLPILGDLLAIARRATPSGGESACGG
jgi:hypothetical protein